MVISMQPNIDAGESHRILIVEDTVISQTLAMMQLKTLGYQADCANHGQEALEMLAQKKYSLILMDCQMPVLDGYAATREIRRLEADGFYLDRFSLGSFPDHIIIVALTASLMSEDREVCIAAGMDDYLSKPVFKEPLAKMLSRWLGG